ncbi:glycoside hydrolase family 5 protein [Novipirellula artificiosorum]|nr:cellulase family glycosylhydrolase [Novipirellula artificiosorum]
MKYATGCFLLALLFASALNSPSISAELPDPSPHDLPRWRGFNLLEKFYRSHDNEAFRESDFQLISELGFNFVRLPMDYRVWIEDGDWNQFNEAQLKHIDQAVEWGQKYSIHVLINFHRAPGYTVARPAESTDLWTDDETQRICAKHWAMFAKRYRGIPSRYLSFNLFNEPANVSSAAYLKVVKRMAAAIRAEDPDRLILSDGLQWGKQPIPELAELKIAQATRGYTPTDVTHFKASWVNGADQYPVPSWPRVRAYGTLYVPNKPDLSVEATAAMSVIGPFRSQSQFRLHVGTVSSRATLVAKADDQIVWQKEFVCGPGQGEWKESNFMEQWNSYQNVYDCDYHFAIPEGTGKVELSVIAGDWLSLTEVAIRSSDGDEDVLPLRPGWNEPPARVHYDATNSALPFVGEEVEDRSWLWDTTIVPWVNVEQQGVGVMVGEFGCHHFTPHDVVLAWMEDCLANWQRADWGWALWNFRGTFGVMDSGRTDVDYEDFNGHQLDRKMLELLQRY